MYIARKRLKDRRQVLITRRDMGIEVEQSSCEYQDGLHEEDPAMRRKPMADLALEPALDGTVWLYDIDARAAEENLIIGSQLDERKRGPQGRWDYKVAYSP